LKRLETLLYRNLSNYCTRPATRYLRICWGMTVYFNRAPFWEIDDLPESGEFVTFTPIPGIGRRVFIEDEFLYSLRTFPKARSAAHWRSCDLPLEHKMGVRSALLPNVHKFDSRLCRLTQHCSSKGSRSPRIVRSQYGFERSTLRYKIL
jgi:hypothetical protein